MKITQETDYALRMICHLAKVDPVDGEAPAPMGAASLAEAVAVPTRFGIKILHKLAEAGLVRTSRGVSGGYSLACEPRELTMRQVIEAIEGPIRLNRCLDECHPCPNSPDKEACRLHHVFGTLNAGLADRLDRLTVAMLVDDHLGLGDLLAILA